MSIFGHITKGFSIAASSGSLVLTVFAFSFIWMLVNLPFVSADGATQPTAISAILGILFVLISIFIQCGSIGYVEQVIKQGKSNLGTFAEAGKKHYLRMLGLGIVIGLVMVILAVLAVLGFVAGGAQTEPSPVAIAFAVILAIVGMVTLLFIFLAPYAVVVESKGVLGALKASIAVVKENFLTVLGIGIILVLIGFAIGFALGLVIGFAGGALPGKAGQIVAGFLSSAVNAYLGIITTGAFMTLYLSKSGSASR